MAGASALVLPALSKAGGLRMRAGASKTQLTLMGLFFIPSELAAAREIINEFNAQSKTIHVQYVQSSWGAIGSKMTAAVRVSERRWDLHLDPKVTVRLPETGMPAALHLLSSLITDRKILERDITAIDLRLPDRLIIESAHPVSSHPGGDMRL